MTSRTLSELTEALSNVLRRKRADRLGLEQRLADCAKRREAPPRGMGSEYHTLCQQIRTLEAALEAAAQEAKRP